MPPRLSSSNSAETPLAPSASGTLENAISPPTPSQFAALNSTPPRMWNPLNRSSVSSPASLNPDVS